MAWSGRKVYEMSELTSFETLDTEKNSNSTPPTPPAEVAADDKNFRGSPDSDRYDEPGIVRDSEVVISPKKENASADSGEDSKVKEEKKKEGGAEKKADVPTKKWKRTVKMGNLWGSKLGPLLEMLFAVDTDLLLATPDGRAVYAKSPEVEGSDLIELFDYVLTEERVKKDRAGKCKFVNPLPRPPDLIEFLKVLRAAGISNEYIPRNKFFMLKQLLTENDIEMDQARDEDTTTETLE